MSSYEARLTNARYEVRQGMIGLSNRQTILLDALICREPLQDDEDDALMEAWGAIQEATRYINFAIEALEG
jgi:hypothetical protein